MNAPECYAEIGGKKTRMFPMEFEEFLWAMGDGTTVPYLRECFEALRPLGQAMHTRIMNDFRQ